MLTIKHKLLSLFTLLTLASVLGGVSTVNAQSSIPQILLNWQASTYTPRGYSGKVLPTSDSQIIASVDLFYQGKKVDLSGIKISWYINENFYQSSVGLSRITLTAPHFVGANSIQLRVSIPDYANGPGKTVVIPVAAPEVVILSSAPSLNAASTPFNLYAYPYFFNVQDPSQLQFSWKLRGNNTGNQNVLNVTQDMARNGATIAEVSVSNPLKVIERASRSLTLFQSR